jgi:cell division protease FtsH
MTLGGRAAEQIFFEKVSTGAQNDLERITKLAYGMVTNYGMSKKVGQISFNDPTGEYGYQRPYSEKTAELIDQEVRKMIDDAYVRTTELLTEKKSEVEAIAKELLTKEIIFKGDIERIIGARPYEEDEVSQQVSQMNQPKAQIDAPVDDSQETTESGENTDSNAPIEGSTDANSSASITENQSGENKDNPEEESQS